MLSSMFPIRRLPASIIVLFFAFTAISWAALALFVPQRPVRVKVRWAHGVEDAQRRDLERRFHLRTIQFDQGTTWTYDLDDASTGNIRSLVQDDDVDDTAGLNRLRFRPPLRYDAMRQRVALAPALGLLGVFAWVVMRSRRTTATAPQEHEELSAPPLPQQRIWLVALLATTAPILVALCHTMWRSPYPISEVVAVLEGIQRSGLEFFDPRVRSWYRPFYHLSWYVFWNGTGSLDGALLLFRLLGIASAAGLVLLFIRHIRPRTVIDWGVGTVAVAALIGMPGFRANLELPLFMTLVGMPLILIVWMLLERQPRPWQPIIVATLTLLAIGFKEQGLVIVPLVLACWWMGSPGATRSTALTVLAVGCVYLAIRLSTSGSWALFEQDVGYGFRTLSPDGAEARFRESLWTFRAYSVAATVLNLLFSEPTDGRFAVIANYVAGMLRPWQAVNVASSIALTGLIAWWGAASMRNDRGRAWSRDSRVFGAMLVTVAASGVLGFSYTRDRFGGMAVPFIALAAYFALRHAAERLTKLRGPALASAVMGLVLLGTAWQLRAVGTLEETRLWSQKNQREWLTDLWGRQRDYAGRVEYLDILHHMTAQGLDQSAPRTSDYPDWLRSLVGAE